MGYNSLSPVVFESVSNVTLTNSVELGTRQIKDGRSYIYVYNAGTSQAVPGQGMTVSGVSGYSVTVSSTTMADQFFGAVYHSTLVTASYGWLLTQGFGKVKAPASSGLAAGDPVVAGGDGVFTTQSTLATFSVLAGKVMVATASAGVGEAYLNLGFGN